MDENILGKMLQSMADTLSEERKKKEPYKEMFKAGSSYTSLLRSLELQMTGPVLDACDVIKERFGVSVSKDQYHILLALPLLVKIATQQAEREGAACSVDKAYFLISEQLVGLGKTNPPQEQENEQAAD